MNRVTGTMEIYLLAQTREYNYQIATQDQTKYTVAYRVSLLYTYFRQLITNIDDYTNLDVYMTFYTTWKGIPRVWKTLDTWLYTPFSGCRQSQLYVYKSLAVLLKFKTSSKIRN